MLACVHRLAIPVCGPILGWFAVWHGLLCEQNLSQEGLYGRPVLMVVSPCKVIMFSDLESDYINPIDLCNKLNQVRVIVFFSCAILF